MSKTWRAIALIGMVVAALLLLAAIIVLGGLILIPPLASASITPLEVSIRGPHSGDQIAPGLIEVEALALGSQPVTSMQLWVDGTPVVAASPETGEDGLARATFQWTPAHYGPHVLSVRAEDRSGYAALSAPVSLRISPPGEAAFSPIRVPAQEGDTLADLAGSFGVSPEALLPYNPGLDPAAPLTAGTLVQIPLLPPQPLPLPVSPPAPPAETPDFGLGVDAGAAPASPQPVTVTSGLGLFLPWNSGVLPAPPAAPGLAAEVSGCGAALSIQDNSADELGFTLYRMAGADAGFLPIATLGPVEGSGGSFSYSDTPGGDAIYTVASLNAAGETMGGMAAADLGPDCANGPDAPQQISLSNALLVPVEAYDRAYCYTGGGAGLWQRVPPGPSEFLLPNPNGSFSLGASLPGLPADADTLALECWGWQGGTLRAMGAAVGSLPAAGETLSLDGGGFQFSASLVPLLNVLLLNTGGPTFFAYPTAPNVVVPPPYGLQVFYDGPSNQIELRWDWHTVSCFPGAADCPTYAEVAGFKLYNQEGALIVGMDDPGRRNAILSASGTPEAKACYFLTSFSADGYESTPSALGCAIPPELANPFAMSSERLGYPYDLFVTSDPAVCVEGFQGPSKVIGALLCQGATDSRMIVLRWSWEPAGWCQPAAGCDPISEPDGYYVYEYIAGSPVLVETIDDPGQLTAFIANPTEGQGVNLSDMCYEVVAYSGDLRSQSSGVSCADLTTFNLDGPQALAPDRVRANMSTYLNRIKTIGSDIYLFNYSSGELPFSETYSLFRLTKYRNLTAGPDVETTVNLFNGVEFGWRLDAYDPEDITAATLSFSADGLLYEGEPDETASFLSDLNNAIPYVPDPLGFLVNIALTPGTTVSLDEYELVGGATCIARIGYGEGLFLTRASELTIEDGAASTGDGGLFLVEDGQISGPLAPGEYSFDVLAALQASMASQGRFWVTFVPPHNVNEKTNTLCDGRLHNLTLHLTINQ